MQKKNKFKVVSVNKSRYILPSVLTLIGVCLGITSIKFAMDGNFGFAVLFIIGAAILDGLDGRVARMIKGTSDFGKELDSLTDFVSFGIAPAFIIYFWELDKYGKIGWLIVLFYSVCCVLRLARFNVTKFEGDENGNVTAVHVHDIEWVSENGRFMPKKVEGSERVLKADLVLLAMGFLGPENTIVEELGLDQDPRSNIKAEYGEFKTSVDKVFAAGDVRRGQSLIVWAINEGRAVARECDRFLMGATQLP